MLLFVHICVASKLSWWEQYTGISEIMGSNPLNFSSAQMRQSLRLSSKCKDLFFNSSPNHSSETFLALTSWNQDESLCQRQVCFRGNCTYNTIKMVIVRPWLHKSFFLRTMFQTPPPGSWCCCTVSPISSFPLQSKTEWRYGCHGSKWHNDFNILETQWSRLTWEDQLGVCMRAVSFGKLKFGLETFVTVILFRNCGDVHGSSLQVFSLFSPL